MWGHTSDLSDIAGASSTALTDSAMIYISL